ncbi:MAG TPA: asparagine synthase (glutamine-hydrolyzing) [Lentisphaeria bacterium]|nr:MAG: asparagine synthase (glutamine-hydrolyzing) [Lentisphaerae bacterium GWF2_49_21]HBC87122.1 asparagine synthase (glutamine-hydrolyzing) [Lentisphaeria bacterium]
MCGISGFFNYLNPAGRDILDRMNMSLSHRGPDGEGSFLENGTGLAHRRLAIIDIATGMQPMHSQDGRYVTIFNGEIYNYLELRDELVKHGCKFRTNSDTEVIAESIRIWSIGEGIKKFRGMFAFAVFDRIERTLYLGRDRTGIKPLYWSEKGGSLFFASEIKALLTIPEVSRRADFTGLNDFLTLGFPIPPKTCWQDISNFPPAHYGIVRHGADSVLKRYWKWEISKSPISEDEAIDKAVDVLCRSLKFHIRSDVPLGAFLSGGIDSSLLVYLITNNRIKEKLSTFNVKFPEFSFDESQYSEEIARICGSNHHVIEVSKGSPDMLEKVLSQYDEPFGDSSSVPTYLISAEMKKHVKTVISGDGGDELFGGYDRIRYVSSIYGLRNLPMKDILCNMLSFNSSFLGSEKLRQFRKAIAFSKVGIPELFCLLHSYFTEEEKIRMCNKSFLLQVKDDPTWSRMEKFIPNDKETGIGNMLMGTELNLNLQADYLRKVDIASSAHGIEVRVPFLDNEVIDFAAKLPIGMKIRGKECKYLLREIMRKNVSSIIGNRRKQGFGIPFDSWSKGSLSTYIKDLLFSQKDGEGIWRILNNKKTVVSLFDKFTDPSPVNYSTLSRHQIYQRIFMLCGIQVWMNKHNPEL